MPQVTLSVPQNKMPLLRNILKSIGMEDKIMSSNNNRDNTSSNKPRNTQDKSMFNSFGNWEFFRNELEFE
ncbi:MAG: hypothetical protein JWQ96_1485 [Segetibacter sp.]|nr:hypothetical protein [Segetibacter sp.]